MNLFKLLISLLNNFDVSKLKFKLVGSCIVDDLFIIVYTKNIQATR